MEEAIIKKILPHSIEAEQSVIGAMLMDKDAIMTAGELIDGSDFYQSAYGVLFDSMVELFNEGRPVDLVTLQERLREKNVPPEISSMEFVRELITNVPTSANVKYYAEIVQEKSTLRRLIKLNEEIANTCYVASEPLESILEDTEKRIFELVQHRNTKDYTPIKQVVMNALDRIEKASKTTGTVTGIPTGFMDLDYKLSGLQRSDLVLIAARPSMGKTAFVLNIAQNVAFRENMTVAIFSLEMSKEQLVNRLFSLEAHVDAQLIRTGNLKDTDWEKLIEGAGTIGKSKMIIDDTSGISITEMRSKCRKYKLELGLDMIIIDYLQLMSGRPGRNSDNRQQEISDISRSLKGLARELDVPVVALSQLSRAVEQRTDKRPMLSDLRESGAIEQDADVVMFIYREDYYIKDTEDKNIAEIIIAKQRNGPIGTVRLAWLPQYTRFGNAVGGGNDSYE
ncbi:replicative DNA helicase [Hespellia stercorisuis]|uniref:Replicative DNA helicase n=1 Tax=Hespellia stercorisuis DSM 15480 TaxID=1121950 RepID=A0A1M6RB93_9FIRM|nr:replicative DNA helicase [Hespellia stercorisuis]SHK29690.1 replicative DNA helicase [Hespellia stercorisuis DSM 15480]